ncbi:hypothetical protein LSH36_314g01059 [Paralvinella palmiformis]|uniref:SUEL-type lectin domain-containing protein n=1 Tax=Paralvinella palmiformis TaxID=53620 RepID=A0AAD9N0S9_9ANNE|nr:hypothetical protein LSH36_314g01059 [Paralvinella palmiformis]
MRNTKSIFTFTDSTRFISVCTNGYWNDELCPVNTILKLEDVEIGLPSCRVPCRVSQSLSDVQSLNESHRDLLLEMKFRCNGRRKCENLYLQPVVNNRYRCKVSESFTDFKRFTYRCLPADTKVVVCNDEMAMNVSCESDKVLHIQNIIYGAICTYDINITCTENKSTNAILYLEFAKESTLHELREKCHGRNQCQLEVKADPFLHRAPELCTLPKHELNEASVYFSCKHSASWSSQVPPQTRISKYLLTIFLPIGILIMIIIVIIIVIRTTSVNCVHGRSRRIPSMLPRPEHCREPHYLQPPSDGADIGREVANSNQYTASYSSGDSTVYSNVRKTDFVHGNGRGTKGNRRQESWVEECQVSKREGGILGVTGFVNELRSF